MAPPVPVVPGGRAPPVGVRAQVWARASEPVSALAPVRESVPVWEQARVSELVKASVPARARALTGAAAPVQAGVVQAWAARVSGVPASVVLVSAARVWVAVQAAWVARSVAPRPAGSRLPCAQFRSRLTPARPAAAHAGRLQWQRQYRSVGSSWATALRVGARSAQTQDVMHVVQP